MLFIKILSEFKLKANTIWVDKSNEFYIRSARSWFQSNIIEMYLTNHLGKYVCKKDLLELWKLKSTNAWLQYPKICILIN